MKKVLTLALIALFSQQSHSSQAWNYIGIPYVTDNVPGAIMPTLPTGADTPAFPYDPCSTPTPTFSGAPNQYFVSSLTGDDANAGNNGNGTKAAPRRTLPGLSQNKWVLAPGQQIFIESGSKFFDGINDVVNVTVHSNGTEDSPCWIIGDGIARPTFAGDKFFMGGTHLFVHNIRFANSGGPRIKFGNKTEKVYMQYGTLRKCLIDGLGGGHNAAIGGSGLSHTERASYICIYQNIVRNLGDWDRQDSKGSDKHGIQMTSYTDHWWIIENEIYHCEGDSIQINTSGQGDGIYAARPHYIYVAGNRFYENYENAIDNKNCYHTIQSGNKIYGFRNPYKAANSTAYILSNDAEGWLSSFEWALYNEISDAGTGIRIASTASETIDNPNSANPIQISGQRSFAIGNLITNVDNGIVLDARGNSPGGALSRQWYSETWTVNNTIVSLENGITQSRGNKSSEEPGKHVVLGNIIYNWGSGDEVGLGSNNRQTNEVKFNVIYKANSLTQMKISNFDLYVGNILDARPLFIDQSNNIYHTTIDSPNIELVDSNIAKRPYELFFQMYGIDIKVDINGNTRPLDRNWSAGSYEIVPDTEVPNTPSNLMTIPQ